MLLIKSLSVITCVLSVTGYFAEIIDQPHLGRTNDVLDSPEPSRSKTEVSTTDDEEITQDSSGDADRTNDMLTNPSFTNKDNGCCKIGELLASLSFDCRNIRFSDADRRRKVALISSTFGNLGVDITDSLRASLYTPFRRCVLQQAWNIDKCCLTKRGLDNAKMNVNTRAKRLSRTHRTHARRQFSRSRYQHHIARADNGCTSWYCRYMRSTTKQKHNVLELNSKNMDWETWLEYRSSFSGH